MKLVWCQFVCSLQAGVCTLSKIICVKSRHSVIHLEHSGLLSSRWRHVNFRKTTSPLHIHQEPLTRVLGQLHLFESQVQEVRQVSTLTKTDFHWSHQQSPGHNHGFTKASGFCSTCWGERNLLNRRIVSFLSLAPLMTTNHNLSVSGSWITSVVFLGGFSL